MNLNPFNAVTRIVTSAIALLIITWSAYVYADQAATIDSLSGHVTVALTNGDVKLLKEGDTIESGVLNTGSDSSISLTLSNGEVVTLGSLATYTLNASYDSTDKGLAFAQRSLSSGSPTLSTATSAGGAINQDTDVPPTTPAPGGSPSN